MTPKAVLSSLQSALLLLSLNGALVDSSDRLFFSARGRAVGPAGGSKQEDMGVVRVQEGQNVIFECEAMGSPGPVIHWLFHDKRVMQGMSNNLSDESAAFETTPTSSAQPTLRISSTKSRLFIDCARPEDAGEYTCVADTPTRRITEVHTLEVEKTSEEASLGCFWKRQEAASNDGRIFMWTSQRLELEGGDVQLFCRAEGRPNPKVTWFDRDNKTIKSEDEQFQLLGNGDLLIKGVTWSKNMGLYRCSVENGSGTDEVTTFLYPTVENREEKKRRPGNSNAVRPRN